MGHRVSLWRHAGGWSHEEMVSTSKRAFLWQFIIVIVMDLLSLMSNKSVRRYFSELITKIVLF